MSLEELLEFWKKLRAGVIDELAQIPAEQFGFNRRRSLAASRA